MTHTRFESLIIKMSKERRLLMYLFSSFLQFQQITKATTIFGSNKTQFKSNVFGPLINPVCFPVVIVEGSPFCSERPNFTSQFNTDGIVQFGTEKTAGKIHTAETVISNRCDL